MKVTSLLALLALLSCASPEKPKDPIQAKSEKFQQCYHESDSYGDRIAGKVVTEFRIDAQGKVQDEAIHSTEFKDPNLHACLLEQLRKLSFEAGLERPETLTETFNFTPVLNENI